MPEKKWPKVINKFFFYALDVICEIEEHTWYPHGKKKRLPYGKYRFL